MSTHENDDFATGVQDGLRLAKRIYFGTDRSVAPPKTVVPMEKAATARPLFPTSPMVYAVISNPAIVDNPDMPSYQPHVHGRCSPPALIPLQMNGISFDVDCYLDTVFVTMTGSWRVHCVMGNASCPCRIAVPMGEEGSILGAEVEVPRKTYTTQLASMDEKQEDKHMIAKPEDGGYLKPHIFTLTIPQVDGGSNLSIKVRWSQKVTYKDGEFILNVPYSFPEYVTPAGKKLAKKEQIQLNINSGLHTEVVCNTTSHPLKERKREPGKLSFLHEANVLAWSSTDFVFTYHVIPINPFCWCPFCSLPSTLGVDERQMFSLCLFAGHDKGIKVCRKEVLYVVDISESMKGKTIEATKSALIAALSKLDQEDSFGIMAFNEQTHLYSSTLELATMESIKNATKWIETNFLPGGGTNIAIALDQALEMLSKTSKSVPMVFFVTDGAVENGKEICEAYKNSYETKDQTCVHVSTRLVSVQSAITTSCVCSHDRQRPPCASYDADLIEDGMEKWFSKVYPSTIPDVCFERPLLISGRYKGDFPDTVLARRQIEYYTAQAWFSEDKELEEKVRNISLATGTVSEYTRMILYKTELQDNPKKQVCQRSLFVFPVLLFRIEDRSTYPIPSGINESFGLFGWFSIKSCTGRKGKGKKGSGSQRMEPTKLTQQVKVLHHLGLGFGSVSATIENIPPAFGPRLHSQTEKIAMATGNCCSDACGKCCCMCCLQSCSNVSNQCSVVLTQICGILTCFGCSSCCE
ncbi:hypothetical protein OSB04_020495 [Centaurea solstitialis]|uniref:VWFA domain-containing protein n=1 Tax=Centaurea solstitialis TaxID=347529 RepID=A0AA38W5X7_9ASTR|nr:hypothetical protein OSB04_020495 [Centaurea solstitialis]